MAAIRTEGLSKHYGAIKAVDNLNLEVPENVVFGFLGPNGAGKTTTVKLLTGFARPTAGRAWVAGEAVDDGRQAFRSSIGLLPDVPAFYDWMSGRELLCLVGELHRLPGPEIKRRADELLEMVDLARAGGRRIGGYSRGMRQRLGIAQALVNRPRVLFMDEPASALDPMGRRDVLSLIARLRQTATVFMSTHILSDVERVCDMVGIVDKGVLITVSSMDDLRQRFTGSVFEMEFMEDPGPFRESLQKVPWLTGPEIVAHGGASVLRVKAADVDRARKELPRVIGESGLTLTRYELVLPTIEDIFMDIVNRRGPA